MTEQNHIYQAMFLLDNQEVRKGFNTTRDWLKGVLEKHGIQVRVLRFWGERKLNYKIQQRHRATYMLGWLEASGDAVAAVKRDLYLVGPCFRVLFLREDEIPEDELEFGIEEVDEATIEIPEDKPDEIVDEPYEEEPAPTAAEEKEKKGEADAAPKKDEEGEAKAATVPAGDADKASE